MPGAVAILLPQASFGLKAALLIAAYCAGVEAVHAQENYLREYNTIQLGASNIITETIDSEKVAPSSGQTEAPPVAMINPAHPEERVFTFSFASGHHPVIRAGMELIDAILLRTLYRPFMRFMPATLERVAVPVPGLPPRLNGFSAVQMSDVHHSQTVPLAVIEQAVETANKAEPQSIFLTGDFVTNDVRYMAACARALGKLVAPLGVYAILGNHDYWTDPAEVRRQLQANGIAVLDNEARRLADGLWVAGLDDIWSGQPDLQKALAGIPAGDQVILLAHEPDFADQAQGRHIAVQLSGHGHGGQVHVPFTRRPVLPVLAWKYYAGLQRVGDLWVYTNRGLGTMLPPFVFTCRPEVTLLRLSTAAGI
jgi:predicted MPP superfamily phosphohydrolase